MIKFRFSFLLGERSSEIIQGNSIEFDVVIGIVVQGSVHEGQGEFVAVVCELREVVAQVVTVVRVLTHAVEERDFEAFVGGEGFGGVVALAIFPVDFLGYINHLFLGERVLRIDD